MKFTNPNIKKELFVIVLSMRKLRTNLRRVTALLIALFILTAAVHYEPLDEPLYEPKVATEAQITFDAGYGYPGMQIVNIALSDYETATYVDAFDAITQPTL